MSSKQHTTVYLFHQSEAGSPEHKLQIDPASVKVLKNLDVFFGQVRDALGTKEPVKRLFIYRTGVEVTTIKGLTDFLENLPKKKRSRQKEARLQFTDGAPWKKLYYEFGDLILNPVRRHLFNKHSDDAKPPSPSPGLASSNSTPSAFISPTQHVAWRAELLALDLAEVREKERAALQNASIEALKVQALQHLSWPDDDDDKDDDQQNPVEATGSERTRTRQLSFNGGGGTPHETFTFVATRRREEAGGSSDVESTPDRPGTFNSFAGSDWGTPPLSSTSILQSPSNLSVFSFEASPTRFARSPSPEPTDLFGVASLADRPSPEPDFNSLFGSPHGASVGFVSPSAERLALPISGGGLAFSDGGSNHNHNNSTNHSEAEDDNVLRSSTYSFLPSSHSHEISSAPSELVSSGYLLTTDSEQDSCGYDTVSLPSTPRGGGFLDMSSIQTSSSSTSTTSTNTGGDNEGGMTNNNNNGNIGNNTGDDAEHEETNWALGDFNARFQHLMSKLSECSEHLEDPIFQKQHVLLHEQLLDLSQDFINTVKTYGRLIILEKYLPSRKQGDCRRGFFKTIDTTEIMQGAGGDKFIVSNILFKFAADVHGLFGGDDSAAAKACGQELLGHAAYFELGLPGVHFPLMALVDYMGFRLLAMSMLPIDDSTLIYGSANRGRLVRASNSTFNALMRDSAERLNLKPHVCGVEAGQTKKLYAAADVEGHRGHDGRFYLIDFARTFPPFPVDLRFRNGHLYRFFRPEFMSKYHTNPDPFPTPLCPDIYSGFIAHDPNRKQHFEDVEHAQQHLFNRIIPNVARGLKWLCQEHLPGLRTPSIDSVIRVPEELHRCGCNLRLLGHIINASNDRMVRFVLLVELLARVLKNELRRRLRRKMAALKLPLEAPYRQLLVAFLNQVFWKSKTGILRYTDFWDRRLTRNAQLYFAATNFSLDSEVQSPSPRMLFNESLPRQQDSTDADSTTTTTSTNSSSVFTFMECLIYRFFVLTGLQVANQSDAALRGDEPFVALDFRPMEVKIKTMAILSSVQGHSLVRRAKTMSDSVAAMQLYQQAIAIYENALQVTPSDWQILLRLADSYMHLLLLTLPKQSLPNIDPNNPLHRKVREVYQKVRIVARENPFVRAQYSMFLQKCEKLEEAENQALRALEFAPTNQLYYLRFVHMLKANFGDQDAADRFQEQFNKLDALFMERSAEPQPTAPPPIGQLIREASDLLQTVELQSFLAAVRSGAETLGDAPLHVVGAKVSEILRDYLLAYASVPVQERASRLPHIDRQLLFDATASALQLDAYISASDPRASLLAEAAVSCIASLSIFFRSIS